MSITNFATSESSFEDIFHNGSEVESDTEMEERDPIVETQRLDLKGPEIEQIAPKPIQTATPFLVPKLEGNERRRPLALVELPIDVLREIVQEVTHTNDLTNLCLTCRCLRSLATPQIYSRFDIVWPDAASSGDRVGVDALTHGLATLTNVTRRGNDHARWVKKFSLGNGPVDWVSEYNINKEGGKMLGTLVNLALSRMESLETFSWDMPTGILRDVFMSLHDLNGTLKNLHVRFHDNRETTPPSSQDPSRRVESPTFRGFKDLRSLGVLDIDERQYLEEMSYAIEESADKLKELKVGIAEHMSALQRWVRDWDDLDSTTPDPGYQDGAIGGILGILFSRIVDLDEERRKCKTNRHQALNTVVTPAVASAVSTAEAVVMTSAAPAAVYVAPLTPGTGVGDDVDLTSPSETVGSTGGIYTPASSTDEVSTGNPVVEGPQPLNKPQPEPPVTVQTNGVKPKMRSPVKLKLETLALEHVPITVSVLVNTKAIDWTCLSNLTILNCFNHERLWKALRRKFSPFSISDLNPSLQSAGGGHSNGGILHSSFHSHRSKATHQSSVGPDDYKIRLKKLHTDFVSPALIAFIRDALPPNSLEILFLQETSSSNTVTMDNIYKGAIRRHKGSLKKLLVNSKNLGEDDSFRKWVFKREHIAFISSGKVPNLREFGLALEYKDWHYFLTRLPYMQHIRSLYITHIRDTPHLTGFAPRELANQILNTVILRPEIELCYVGIATKCFEILEGSRDESDQQEVDAPVSSIAPISGADQDSDEEEDSELEEDGDEDDDMVDDGGEYSESDGGFAEEENRKTGIRLREILFYDDKIELFRARTGSL